MKKLLALILALFCISSVTAYATAPVVPETKDAIVEDPTAPSDTVYISDDLSSLFSNDRYFIKFNPYGIETDGFNDFEYTVSMSDETKENIQDVELYLSAGESVISATYNFKDGTSLGVYYLLYSLESEYKRIISSDWQYGEIDFEYPYDNQLSINQEKLYGKQINLITNEISDYNYHEFRVYATSKLSEIKLEKGMLIVSEDKYYFVDYEKAGIVVKNYFNIADYSELLAFEITDENLCDKIGECIEAYYDDDFGFFDDDGFTNAVSKVMLTIMFLIFPLAVFVFALILAIRSKGYYKKIFRILYISAIVTLVLVVVLFLIL